METHFMIFVNIGDLVSPSSSVFVGQAWGLIGPPPERKVSPFSAAWEIRADKPRGLLSRSCHLRARMITHTRGFN